MLRRYCLHTWGTLEVNASAAGGNVGNLQRTNNRNLISDSVGALGGAALGLAVAGPAGTLVGAAIGPALARLTDLAVSRGVIFWRTFYEALRLQQQSEAEWADSVSSSVERENALLEVFKVAGRTVDPERLRILAVLAARAPSMEAAAATTAALLASIIGSLSPLHLRALRRIEEAWPLRSSPLGVQPDELLEIMEEERALARSLVRSLELHGLIVDNARLSGSIGVFWEVTELGRYLLALITTSTTLSDPENDHVAPE